ncbi:MAG: hypothetical protein NWR72_03125 [Bacteroidia bacterium]|nr:hypothetical protein [Bacteroidia bacterium]
MKTFNLFTSLVVLGFALSSCDPIEPIPDPSACIELSGSQSTPLVLTNHNADPNDADYCVTGDFNIRADVVVEPGVTILMKNGAKIEVQTGGSFKSVGTETEKITIRGEELLEKGQWEYIRFRTNDTDNRLEYTNITGGGSDPTYDANVFIAYDGYAKIDHCYVGFSQSNGIKCENQDSNLGGIANTDISFCDLYPISIDARHLPNIESTNTGTGNTYDKIDVEGSQLTNPFTWKKSPFLPYHINGTLAFTNAVTVQPGTSIFMAGGANIQISSSGSFNCVGTASEKIRIMGDNMINGSWEYIRFFDSSSTQNRFEHCIISYGGGDNTWEGMITLVYSSYCRIGNSEIKGSARYGVQNLNDQATFVDDGNNTWSDNTLGRLGN